MRTRSIVLTLAVCALAVALSAVDNVFMGTWKLNETKSKMPAGAGTNTTVVYSPAGDEAKVTTDGVDAQARPSHSEWTDEFDGKPHPVTDILSIDSRSVTAKGDRILDIANMKDGKTVGTGKTEEPYAGDRWHSSRGQEIPRSVRLRQAIGVCLTLPECLSHFADYFSLAHGPPNRAGRSTPLINRQRNLSTGRVLLLVDINIHEGKFTEVEPRARQMVVVSESRPRHYHAGLPSLNRSVSMSSPLSTSRARIRSAPPCVTFEPVTSTLSSGLKVAPI